MIPKFEESTSPLTQSNDGRLKVEYVNGMDARAFVLWYAGDIVLHTAERVIADAYIAGYDLATTGTI